LELVAVSCELRASRRRNRPGRATGPVGMGLGAV